MTTMAERRQLLIEIDRTFKLIAEGLETFDQKLEEIKEAPNKQQKEKHMTELKEELKKLQRYRSKVMTWTTCKEVKDKRADFEEQRLIIETRMETYREMERADKTKPFSEKALEAEPKIDPIQRDHDEIFQWLRQTIRILKTQMEPWEAESERLTAESSQGRTILTKVDDLRLRISQNQQHIGKLELIMRYLHNDSVDFQEVKDLRETVEAYVESQRDSRCAVDVDYADIYDDLLATVRENDLMLPVAQNQLTGGLTTANSIDGLDEEAINNRPLSSPIVVEPSTPSKRAVITIPNFSIEDHHRKAPLPKLTNSSQDVVVPAPTPPPLSMPYSRVAASRLQQALEIDDLEILSRGRENGSIESKDIRATADSQNCSSSSEEEEALNPADNPRSCKESSSPIEFYSRPDSPVQKSTSTSKSSEEILKTPSMATADFLVSTDESTDDTLALICDPEKLNLISHQTTPIALPDFDDRDSKSETKPLLPSFASPEISKPSIVSKNGFDPKCAAFPFGTSRVSKLPFAFDGASKNGASDGDDWNWKKDEALKFLDAAARRIPHPDESMRSGHRRLWREQLYQSSMNPNYPIYHHYNNYGVDLNSCSFYSLLTDEALMFAFYYLQGTLSHRYAIDCLEERGWMWHVQLMQWFKHETADVWALRHHIDGLDKKNGLVAGSFRYFDFEKWEEKQATSDFVFRLEFWKSSDARFHGRKAISSF